MRIVTHPKLRSLHPDWAPFHGVSLIFEHWQGAGSVHRPSQAVAPASTQFTNVPELMDAFGAVAQAIAVVGAERLMTEQLLCLLPPDSYHVTVADLVHDGNLDRIRPDLHESTGRALATFSETSSAPPVLPQVLHQIGLTPGVVLRREINFVSDGLDCTKGRAAMLRLRPARSEDAEALSVLTTWRRKVQGDLHAVAHLRGTEWHPHLSLGYFASQALADSTAPVLQDLDQALNTHLADKTFTFDAVAVYAFVSMARYVRLDPDTAPRP